MRISKGYQLVFTALLTTMIVGYAGKTEAGTLLSADRSSVAAGQTVVLSWNSPTAYHCRAGGAWSGLREPQGSSRTQPLLTTSAFVLACLTPRGWVKERIYVTVGKASAGSTTATPTLQLKASATAIKSGENVTLNWSGQAVSNCQASGSWSGSRATSGSQIMASLSSNQTYTLSCDSANGKIMTMTSVQIWSGGTQLSWVPPQRTIDGQPLTDLAAYRIYVGTISQNYYDQIELRDPSATQHFLDLKPGNYYITMTAVDADGDESSMSNEIVRVVE